MDASLARVGGADVAIAMTEVPVDIDPPGKGVVYVVVELTMPFPPFPPFPPGPPLPPVPPVPPFAPVGVGDDWLAPPPPELVEVVAELADDFDAELDDVVEEELDELEDVPIVLDELLDVDEVGGMELAELLLLLEDVHPCIIISKTPS